MLTEQNVKKMIMDQIEMRVQEDLAEIADDACRKVREKIMAQADSLALSILQEYDIRMSSDRVVISVNKKDAAK